MKDLTGRFVPSDPMPASVAPLVQALLARARAMLERETVYWPGAGGRSPASLLASEEMRVAQAWATLDASEQAELAPLAAAAGLYVRDPASRAAACDCSGYVCWALGFSRRTTPASYTTKDGWINTDTIHADAIGQKKRFRRIDKAVPGALLVYPKPADAAYGHVGIVSAADASGRATRVLHCSAENFREQPHDAVKETGAQAFDRESTTIVAWCRLLDPT